MNTQYTDALGTPLRVDIQHIGSAHGDVLPVLQETLQRVTAIDGYQQVTVDLGRVVGLSQVVEVGPDEPTQHIKRPGRDWPSQFALNRSPEPSSLVTIVMEGHKVVTAWIGPAAPREPGDPRATAEDCAWWACHAFAGKPAETRSRAPRNPRTGPTPSRRPHKPNGGRPKSADRQVRIRLPAAVADFVEATSNEHMQAIEEAIAKIAAEAGGE